MKEKREKRGNRRKKRKEKKETMMMVCHAKRHKDESYANSLPLTLPYALTPHNRELGTLKCSRRDHGLVSVRLAGHQPLRPDHKRFVRALLGNHSPRFNDEAGRLKVKRA